LDRGDDLVDAARQRLRVRREGEMREPALYLRREVAVHAAQTEVAAARARSALHVTA
jgi:hypothetical protein